MVLGEFLHFLEVFLEGFSRFLVGFSHPLEVFLEGFLHFLEGFSRFLVGFSHPLEGLLEGSLRFLGSWADGGLSLIFWGNSWRGSLVS